MAVRCRRNDTAKKRGKEEKKRKKRKRKDVEGEKERMKERRDGLPISNWKLGLVPNRK